MKLNNFADVRHMILVGAINLFQIIHNKVSNEQNDSLLICFHSRYIV